MVNNKPKPGGKGENARAAERRIKALTLYKAGMSTRQIGEQLGVSNVSAWHYIKRGLEELSKEQNKIAQHVRDLELRRLDDMLRAIWPKVITGDLKAIDRVLAIQERRAKYLGLDSPDYTAFLNQISIQQQQNNLTINMPQGHDLTKAIDAIVAESKKEKE